MVTPNLLHPHDYTIEVCIRCGAQLSRNTTAGRCPNRAHWGDGGMVVRVAPRPLEQQTWHATKRHWKAIPEEAHDGSAG